MLSVVPAMLLAILSISYYYHVSSGAYVNPALISALGNYDLAVLLVPRPKH
jgi:hypothetical protein